MIVAGFAINELIFTNKTSTATSSQNSSKEATINLAGNYYTVLGEIATVKQLKNNSWEIDYSTSDSDISANFETDWKPSGETSLSKTVMQRSDDYSGFNIDIKYVSASDITITITDENSDYEKIFSTQKPEAILTYEVVLDGDLTPFVGQFSTDEFNQTIVDSGFTYGGYSPEDYYNNQTTVFAAITANGYWNGITSNGNYEVKESDLPVKVDGYYEVHVYGTNSDANDEELVFNLVPPNAKGPDGKVSSERRVFQVMEDGTLNLLTYQKDNWWGSYQAETSNQDLDIAAINSGDFSTLIGTWVNGNGDVVTINSNGTTSDGGVLQAVADSDKTSKVPYVGLSYGQTGAAIGLYKIGFENPGGDQSDTTRPRIIIAQAGWDYPAGLYYCRK